MRLSHIREAPLIRANLLLSQEKSKKSYKTIQPEITKMSELFGVDFDKGLNKSLFDEIEFKDIKSLINSKSSKTQYFLTEFPSLLERPNFISFFSEILMNTENISSVQEIFDGLNKVIKMTYENQFKILIAFILSKNDRFVSDSKLILGTKCKEIEREGKIDQLSQSTIQTLLLLVDSFEETKGESVNFYNYVQSNSFQCSDELKQIADIEKLLELSPEEPIEIEKIYFDIGPLMVNNMLMCEETEMLTYKIDEKRLASFILYILKYQNWVEDKESKMLNKIFLKSMNNEAYKSIDESADKKNVNWNMDNFYKMFKDEIDVMDPKLVFNYFDDPSFSIKDKKKFDLFISTLQKLKILINPNQLFNFIFFKWTNEVNQIEFLSFLINSQSSDYFSFKNYSGEKVRKTADINPQLTKGINNHLIDPWSCIELINVLLKLSKGNYYMKVKELFEWPVQNIPEVVAFGLLAIAPDGDDFLYEELIQDLLTMFLGNHLNSFTVIEEIWNNNKDIVTQTISTMYNSSPDLMNLSRILDISQKLKDSLLLLVNCSDYKFAVNLAILAVKRDFLHIDQWLKDRIEVAGDEFIEELLSYIQENLIAHCRANATSKENTLEKSQLSLESLAVIFENLVLAKSKNNPKVSKRIEDEIKEVYKSIFEIFDELQLQPVNSNEIEQKANGLFQTIFKGEMSVTDAIDKLKEYKDSANKMETEIYACVIHCLLDEYRFYHTYPEKQLIVMSTLFGQIIKHKLIDGVIETIALKYILEGIRKGAGPMFVFGTTALQQFIETMPYNSPYLKLFVEIKQLKHNNLPLYEQVLEKYNEDLREGRGGEKAKPEHGPNYPNQPQNPSIKNISNIGQPTVLIKEEEFEKRQKDTPIHQKKDPQLQKIQQQQQQIPQITQIHHPIFQPQFMVPNSQLEHFSFQEDDPGSNSPIKLLKTQLARPQPNSSIGNLNEMLGRDDHIQQPNQDIIENFKFIFNSMSKNNVSEKSNDLKAILTNDGIIKWFSNFFLVNRVSGENNNHLIYNDLIALIDNKELNNYLVKDTIHYINKLLISDNIEKDLKEKNILKNLGSWLGLMTLSKNKPILAKDLDLKEIIFNAFENGKLSAIINFISKILEHSAKTKVFHSKNPWMQAILSLLLELLNKPNLKQNLRFELENLFKKLDIDTSSYPQSKLLDRLTLPVNTPDFSKQQFTPSIEKQDEQSYMNELYNKINQLDNYLIDILNILNIHKQSLITKQELVRILTQVLSAAINEIISPVVERAVNISLVTTRELVIKDFMFDNDSKKLKLSAANCIKSLAGSLALVTSKEPLRMGFSNKFKEIFFQKNYDSNSIDLIINCSSTELLEIGCSYIHSYVIKKAIEKIQNDETILAEIERRKKGRQFDMKSDLVAKARVLPEVLRPSMNGLTNDQYKIYENFDKIYESYSKMDQTVQSSFFSKSIRMLKEVLGLYTTNTKNYEVCMVNIQNISNESNSNIADDKEQISLLEHCVINSKIEDINIAKELAAISFKYTVLSAKKKNSFLLHIYTTLIKGWVKLYSQIANDITSKLMNNEDISTRFNLELHLCLIIKEIIIMKDYEDSLIEYLNNPFTRPMCRELLQGLKENKIYSQNIFKKIFPFMIDPKHCDIFFQLFSKNNNLPSYLTINNESIIDYKICNIKDAETYRIFSEMSGYAFLQIVDAKYPSPLFQLEKLQTKLKNFLQSPFISNEEQMNVFIMIITELCMKIKLCQKLDLKNISNQDAFYPENEAKCIFSLLTIVPRTINKPKMFANILFGVFKTFHHDYVKSNIHFNQRPYYKLFYTFIYLINDFKSNEEIFNSNYKKVAYLNILTELFRLLSPSNYPGFALAWLDLISCKYFSTCYLEFEPSSRIKDNIQIFEKYLYLIIDLFSYLKNNSNELLSDFNSKVFLDSVYKYIYFLCNTYPEFISSFYFIMMISLPPGNNYIQIKNLILNCTPKDIEKPDPFSEDFKDIAISDKKKNAQILFDISSILQDYGLRNLIDSYIETKNETIIDEIYKKLNSKTKEREYYCYVINTIVVYWSQKLIKQIPDKKIKSGEVVEFFMKMMKSLDPDNRDYLITSMLNELRFPSNQTHFFSFLIILIFCEVKNEVIEEQILRNILERLMYNPRPWGLIVMFLQLIKNPKYINMKKSYISKNNCEELVEKILMFIKTEKMMNYIPC